MKSRSPKLYLSLIKFCNELGNKSFVASPLSAEYVLALLALGSTGEVHSELLETLGFPDDDAIRSSFSLISERVKNLRKITFNVANKVYVMQGAHEVNPELKTDAEKIFDAGFEKIDFSNGAYCADIINKWVEDKTNQRIKDLLSPGSMNARTRLVLVNALYFKGTWRRQFNPQLTRSKPFNINANDHVFVPMMYCEGRFHYGYSEVLQAQILKMDYVGHEASMVIVLPRDVEGLDEVLAKLAAGHNLVREIRILNRQNVIVSIPKFKIETEINLTTLLPKLGIKAIFDENNTGLNQLLTSGKPIYVSTAVQKAFLEVNEEGAEAAAALGLTMMRCSARSKPVSVPRFTADRPFLALIHVKGILFFEAAQRGDF